MCVYHGQYIWIYDPLIDWCACGSISILVPHAGESPGANARPAQQAIYSCTSKCACANLSSQKATVQIFLKQHHVHTFPGLKMGIWAKGEGS